MVVFTWKTLRIENHSSKQENNPQKTDGNIGNS